MIGRGQQQQFVWCLNSCTRPATPAGMLPCHRPWFGSAAADTASNCLLVGHTFGQLWSGGQPFTFKLIETRCSVLLLRSSFRAVAAPCSCGRRATSKRACTLRSLGALIDHPATLLHRYPRRSRPERRCSGAGDAERPRERRVGSATSSSCTPTPSTPQRRCAAATKSFRARLPAFALRSPASAQVTCSHCLHRAGMHVAATAASGGAVPACGAPAAAAARPPLPRSALPPPRASSRAASSSPHVAQPSRSAATAATAAAPGLDAEVCPVSAAAFATALDAGAELPDSWLAYWQQQEAKREARRALIGSTRGRQQQRLRQVATLLSNGSIDLNGGGSPAAAAAAAAAGLHLRPPSSSSGSTRGSKTCSSSGMEATDDELLLSEGGGEMDGGSMDLPPLQQMSELDELTWLASHPPDSEAAHTSSSSSGDGSSSGGGDAGMHLWAAAGQPPHAAQHAQQAQAAQQAQRHPGHIVGLAGSAAEGRSPAGLQGPLQLRVGSDLLSVRPLWIAIYQPEEGGPAK